MWDLDPREGWESKNWCLQTVVLEKTLESPLDCKEIKPFNPEGNQSWTFIGSTDAEAEAAILWPPDVKKWLIGKDPNAGEDWRQEEKGTAEDEIVGWITDLMNMSWASSWSWWWIGKPGVLQYMCCSPWGCKESEILSNWTEYMFSCYSLRISHLLLLPCPSSVLF